MHSKGCVYGRALVEINSDVGQLVVCLLVRIAFHVLKHLLLRETVKSIRMSAPGPGRSALTALYLCALIGGVSGICQPECPPEDLFDMIPLDSNVTCNHHANIDGNFSVGTLCRVNCTNPVITNHYADFLCFGHMPDCIGTWYGGPLICPSVCNVSDNGVVIVNSCSVPPIDGVIPAGERCDIICPHEPPGFPSQTLFCDNDGGTYGQNNHPCLAPTCDVSDQLVNYTILQCFNVNGIDVIQTSENEVLIGGWCDVQCPEGELDSTGVFVCDASLNMLGNPLECQPPPECPFLCVECSRASLLALVPEGGGLECNSAFNHSDNYHLFTECLIACPFYPVIGQYTEVTCVPDPENITNCNGVWVGPALTCGQFCNVSVIGEGVIIPGECDVIVQNGTVPIGAVCQQLCNISIPGVDNGPFNTACLEGGTFQNYCGRPNTCRPLNDLCDYNVIQCFNGAGTPALPIGEVLQGGWCIANCTNEGFTDVSGVFVCDFDLTMLGDALQCAPTVCPAPPSCDLFALAEQVPQSATIVCTPSDENPSALGTECVVTCMQDGYTGSSVFTCAGNNTWVGCPLECEPVACPAFHPEHKQDRKRLHNCTGTYVTGQQCEISCRGKYRYCGTHSGVLTCTGVAPGVSAWTGYQNCCPRHDDDDDHKPTHRPRRRRPSHGGDSGGHRGGHNDGRHGHNHGHPV